MSRIIAFASVVLLLLAAGLPAQTRSRKLVKEVEPECTAEARQKGIRGTVSLTMEVDQQGVPGKIELVSGWFRGRYYEPPGYGLEEKAVEAVSQWRFEPSASGEPAEETFVELGFRCMKVSRELTR